MVLSSDFLLLAGTVRLEASKVESSSSDVFVVRIFKGQGESICLIMFRLLK